MDPRFVLVLGLVATSCAAPASMTAGPAPAPAPSPSVSIPSPGASPSETAAPPVAKELRFSAPLLEGGGFRGQELGGRDVALWFWAPW